MTELEIIKHLAKTIDDREYPYQVCNAFIYGWECDYWVLSARGHTKEFEIKISRSDFLSDIKKEKHRSTETQGANFFYYVCPAHLIAKNELPPKYGLIYVYQNGQVELIKRPKRLNDLPFTLWEQLASKMYWRWRQLWKAKWIEKEINHTEYRQGFTLQLTDSIEGQ